MMDTIYALFDFMSNLTDHLAGLINDVGPWIYLILFSVIFAETGLVVMIFLPGDSLLFVAGSLCAFSQMDVHILTGVLIAAAFLGNITNYLIGRWLGKKLFSRQDDSFFSHKKLEKAHAFYEKHGAPAIVISRFLPLFRTFIPFVAGMAEMTYTRFMLFNLLGAFLWVASFVYVGFFFGQIPFVQENLTLLMLGIIVLTLIPFVLKMMLKIFR